MTATRIVAGAVLLAVAAAWPATARAQRTDGAPRIVVEADRLRPEVLKVPLDVEIRFLNRAGRPIHVEFFGTSGEHHVFQVPASISAVLYVPGRHPFVVHFPDGSRHELHGVVEVERAPRGKDASPPICRWMAVEGNCLEP